LIELLSPSASASHSMSTDATTAILCISSLTNLVYEALHNSLIIIIMDKGEQPSSLSLVVTSNTVGSPYLPVVFLPPSYSHLFSQQHESCRPPQLSSRRQRGRKSHHHLSSSSMKIGTLSPPTTSHPDTLELPRIAFAIVGR
jgi:hypothetical protein